MWQIILLVISLPVLAATNQNGAQIPLSLRWVTTLTEATTQVPPLYRTRTSLCALGNNTDKLEDTQLALYDRRIQATAAAIYHVGKGVSPGRRGSNDRFDGLNQPGDEL
jgi:hypothetical protein